MQKMQAMLSEHRTASVTMAAGNLPANCAVFCIVFRTRLRKETQMHSPDCQYEQLPRQALIHILEGQTMHAGCCRARMMHHCLTHSGWLLYSDCSLRIGLIMHNHWSDRARLSLQGSTAAVSPPISIAQGQVTHQGSKALCAPTVCIAPNGGTEYQPVAPCTSRDSGYKRVIMLKLSVKGLMLVLTCICQFLRHIHILALENA